MAPVTSADLSPPQGPAPRTIVVAVSALACKLGTRFSPWQVRGRLPLSLPLDLPALVQEGGVWLPWT